MAIRTGSDYISALKDGREVWYGGKKVDDVTTFDAFAEPIRSIAALYDLQNDPA
ncbi:MAG: 4-hydroxyphenylacetate 3-hydroxylase N-terminal domain-containing protein, partial [Pseudomonadota bacterium]